MNIYSKLQRNEILVLVVKAVKSERSKGVNIDYCKTPAGEHVTSQLLPSARAACYFYKHVKRH